MRRKWISSIKRYAFFGCFPLIANAGLGYASDNDAELRALVETQGKQIQELKKQIEATNIRPAAAAEAGSVKVDEDSVKKIVADYLKDNPGAGMPSSVQTGYTMGTGFAIRSTPDPKYVNWEDQAKIPFELRIRGRIQVTYDYFKTTDNRNHQTGNLANPATGDNSAPDFSNIEIKRMRLIFEGNAFDPNLRYHIQIDGSTRGINGLDQRQGFFNNPLGNVQGGQADTSVDHAVRLFSAYIAYDFHPCGSQKGCGPDCPEGSYRYVPTITAIAGKLKPLFGLEEYLGSANEQLVEYSMANWFFDADDDNYLMGAGTQIKLMDDRFYLQALVTNGNETQVPNLLMDDLPGINVGLWYDFGGTWNEERKRWDLFGDCLSDIDYSCNPVLRVGGAVNLVPMDRRSLYTTAELDRVRVVPGAPNAGGNLSSLLGGANVSDATTGIAGTSAFAVDAFDSYSYNAFLATKFRGLSLYNEWWLRNLDNFRGERIPGTALDRTILYNANNPGSNTGIPAVFPKNHGMIDYGTTLQAGYFVVPKKLELVARYSWISGESGNINGDGTFKTVSAASLGIPAGGGNPTTIRVVNGAFSHFQQADEIAFGVNYFFRRHLLKWQNDISFYNGGNPAANGQSAAGFIPGVDGFMVRSQIQLAF